MMTSLNRNIVRLVVVSLCCVGLPTPFAQAELIATDRVETAGQSPLSARVRVDSLLDRAEVRAALERHGVSADDAKARVDALSDDEVERLAARFDSLPAAGDALGSFLWFGFLVFVVLLVTDILGFTKVFSFTRPAK
ncbi:MAG TPA: PA2779 family protein [Burkholderiales bacterium]|nr:PA2779 family protein [Burkholderiales bacterium]